jgi:hypothetical protein
LRPRQVAYSQRPIEEHWQAIEHVVSLWKCF